MMIVTIKAGTPITKSRLKASLKLLNALTQSDLLVKIHLQDIIQAGTSQNCQIIASRVKHDRGWATAT